VIDFLSRIGIAALIIPTLMAVYFMLTFLRKPSVNLAFVLIVLSKLLNPIFDGFAFSRDTKLFIGQLNTVSTYFLLAFSVYEVIISKKKQNWNRSDAYILTGLFIIGFAFIFWKFYSFNNVGSSDITYLIVLVLFTMLRPNKSCFNFLPAVSFFLISIVFLCAVFRYQNPYFPYYQTDFGATGPYHNFMWDIFGISERFRGPYISPNILGYNIVILCILTGTTKSVIRIPGILMSLIVLLLSGSKISLFAFFIHIVIRAFNTKRFKLIKFNNLDSNKNTNKIHSRNSNLFIYLGVFVLIVVGYLSDPTLNGRTNNYKILLQSLNGHYFFGNGPSFVGSTKSAENTFVTLLGYYGLVGAISIIMIVLGVIEIFMRAAREERKLILSLLLPLLIATSGESILVGGAYDIGVIYLFVYLASRHSKIST
jgi:hypothetical protein